jgi:hypothetical protein
MLICGCEYETGASDPDPSALKRRIAVKWALESRLGAQSARVGSKAGSTQERTHEGEGARTSAGHLAVTESASICHGPCTLESSVCWLGCGACGGVRLPGAATRFSPSAALPRRTKAGETLRDPYGMFHDPFGMLRKSSVHLSRGGGSTSFQILQLIRGLHGLRIAGFDPV